MGAFFIRWRQQDSICIFSRWEKIEVATSVCTGGRNCPPDSFAAMGSNPACKTEKSRYRLCGIWTFGPDDRIRTCGILHPKYRQNLYIVYSSFLGGFSLI